jgi:hypothetical protein
MSFVATRQASVAIIGSVALESASGELVVFRETDEKPPAVGLVKQANYKLISPIDDIDHQFLHLFVVEPRDFCPGDGTIRTVDHNIRVVTGSRARRDARVETFQKRVPETLEDDQFRKPLWQHRLRNE